MDRNEPAWIVMAAIHQHHAHAEFANHLLVKGLQTTIVVKANQKSMKLQVEFHRSNPIALAHGPLVAVESSMQFSKHVAVLRFRPQHGGNLQNATEVINLLHILQ